MQTKLDQGDHPMSNRTLITMFCVFILMGTPVHATAEQPQISLNELKEHIMDNENKLLNLRVDGRRHTEVWDSASNEWKYSGEAEVTAWFINAPGSKFRVDCHKEVGPWTGGTAPFAESMYSKAYNGRAGQRLTLKAGDPDSKPFSDGLVTDERPEITAGGAFTSGWELSLYGWGDRNGYRLSDVIASSEKRLTSGGGTLSVQNARFNAKQCVQLIIDDSRRQTFYFDPEHGYALIGYKRSTLDGVIMNKVVIEKILEPVPGVYYPGRATRSLFKASGEPREKAIYEASNVVVNDPSFDEEIFTIKWPPGTRVTDEIANFSFTVAKDVDELEHLLDLEVAETVAAVGEPEGSTPIPIPMSVDSPTPASGSLEDIMANSSTGTISEDISKTNKLSVVLLCVAFPLAAILAFILISNAKRRKTQMLLILPIIIFVLHPGATVALEFAPSVQQLGNQRVVSCGLNTTAFILKYFGHRVDMGELAVELKAGAHWGKAVSMLNIKNALQRRGLACEAFGDATFDEIFGLANKDRICVIHTATRTPGVGHYYIVAGVREKAVFCINAGTKASWLPVAKFNEFFEHKFKGYCMFVSLQQRNATKPESYSLDTKEISIELADTISGQGSVAVNVPFLNPFNKDIIVEKIAGSCACFNGATLEGSAREKAPFTIKANSKVVMVLKFTRKGFGAGRVEQKVLLSISKPETRKILLRIKANVTDALEKKIAWFPARIDYGVVYDPNQTTGGELVTLFLPQNIVVSQIQTSCPQIKLSPIDTKTEHTIGDGRTHKRLIHQYEMTLVNVPSTPFREYIEFSITDETMPTITIPVIARTRFAD